MPLNLTLESLRVIAIVAIIWLHTPESLALAGSQNLCRFAVPFFAAASGYLTSRSAARRHEYTIAKIIADRSLRIYLMFALWSVVYYVVRCIGGKLQMDAGVGQLNWATLVNGTAHHLWFLPFIAVGTALAFAWARLATIIHKPGLMAVLTGVAAITSMFISDASIQSPEWYCVRLSLAALPGLLAGMAFGLMEDTPSSRLMRAKWLGMVGLTVCILATAWIAYDGRTSWIENLSGVGLLLFAICLPSAIQLPHAKMLGALTFGVFVFHVLPLEAGQDVLHKLGIRPSVLTDISLFVVTTIFSFVVAAKCATIWPLNYMFSLRSNRKKIPVAASANRVDLQAEAPSKATPVRELH